MSGTTLTDDNRDPAAEAWNTVYFLGNRVSSRHWSIVFSYNSGPGSVSSWLHMGIKGPRRVVIAMGRGAVCLVCR